MRIRHKPWARPELDSCEFFVPNPTENIGNWKNLFEFPDRPLWLELGCGKGGFISQIAPAHPDVNFIAMDIKNEMLVLAKRKLENVEHGNVRIAIQNIERIDTAFGVQDTADRIYINFCNPWNRNKHRKRRLTHTRQLGNYKKFLRGEVRFKTDDDELFRDSLRYFEESGYKIKFVTYDLHSEKDIENFVTEHEKMFSEQGIKIKFLIAEYYGDSEE